MVADGNPKGLNQLSDLAHAGLRFVNRNPGSGTRLWLDNNLRRQKMPSETINGYEKIVKTHTEAAILIQTGKADVAIGLQAAAHQHNLGFIPLFEERYDLVLPREQEKALSPVLDYIQTNDFRKSLAYLTGYNTAHSGEQIPFSEAVMKLSARNVLKGKIVKIVKGAVNSEVVLELSDGGQVVSIITNKSVKSLGLKKNVEAYAVIKASNVMIAMD